MLPSIIIILYKESKSMGNGEYQVPESVRSDWTQHFRKGKSFIQNKITHEQFKFITVPEQQEKDSISKLIERSIYTLPNTPKIIILNSQSGQIFILLQTPNSELKRQISKIRIFIDLLHMLKGLATVYQTLSKKYGAFKITEGMIGINKNCQVIAWVHQNQVENQPQYPLQGCEDLEQKMIENLIEIVQKYTHFNVALNFAQKLNNFSAFINALTKYIYSKKIETLKGQESFKYRQKTLLKSFSPQKTFHRNSRGKSPTPAVDPLANVKKREEAPKFLKALKSKKVNLLESLNHRRTFTRQYQEVLNKSNPKTNKKANDFQENASAELFQVRSLKTSPFKDGFDDKFKNSRNPSNAQTCSHLTSSAESVCKTIKKRQFIDKKSFKSCNQIPCDECQNYTTKNLLQSDIDVNQSLLHQQSQRTGFSLSKTPLENLLVASTQSNYFKLLSNKQLARRREGKGQNLRQTIEQDISEYFSSPPRSPRMAFEYCQHLDLKDEFSRIINY